MKRFLFLVLFLPCCVILHPEVVINELMQSNVDGIMDDLNEYPDGWVELYNNGDVSVNLKDYKLGTEATAVASAWTLPSFVLGPKSFKLVYCDKEAKDWHTDFRLETGNGGALFLFRGDDIIDRIDNLPKQPAPNIAYGRKTDASDEWGWQLTPTPGSINDGKLGTEVLGAPVFSVAGCVLKSGGSVSLKLTLPDGAPSGTVIRYTTDGSEPTSNSPSWGTLTKQIKSTTIIRAKLFCEGFLSPRSTTHSYIVFPRDLTLPVVSIVTDKKHLSDSKTGIYVDGSYKSGTKNYEFDWRRPINFELFEAVNEESVLNQLCETRIQGGASRSQSVKSMVVYANKRFGKKRLKYEFFPDQRPGRKDYKSIILRNAGNDFDYLYMRDAIMQRNMAQHADLDWQSWRPVIIYINGTYKGMLNIRDRSTADNVYTYYDGLEDFDMIENWNELKEGTKDNFNDFTAFYSEEGHTWEEYAEWMDLEEYINFMLLNLYYNNQDWPGNNIVQWRPRAEDGKWRWIAKDTDFGLGLYGSSATYKTLEWFYNPNYDYNHAWANKPEHTLLFRHLMEDETFFNRFIDKASVFMGDFLNYEGTWAVWEPMYKMINTEYPNHRKLINQWWPNYSDELSSAKKWVQARTKSFCSQLSDYYNLGSPIAISLQTEASGNDMEGVRVLVNEVPLSANKLSGKFYAGREVRLSSHSEGTTDVTEWHVVTISTNGKTEAKTVKSNCCSFTMPNANSVMIVAKVGTPTDIVAPVAESDIIEIYDIQGNRREHLCPGLNIVRMSDGTTRKLRL